MSRTTRDQFDKTGQLVNGFDYDLQCWVKGGRVLNCGHPGTSNECDCTGRKYAGHKIEDVRIKEELKSVNY